MKRRLRIAVSVFFALVAVAFVVLWVRSYWRSDQFDLPIAGNHGISITSVRGLMSSWRWDDGARLQFWSESIRDWLGQPVENVSFWYPANQGIGVNDAGLIWMPHGYLILILATLAALPYVSPHFSLRTMFIATTLVAVVLGLGVWLAS